MRKKQDKPKQLKKKNRQYNAESLTNAYRCVVEDGMSVYRASKQFNVPKQTLRDRVLNKVDIDCLSAGRAPVFSLDREVQIVNHVKRMANLGYGYTRQEVVNIASEFSLSLGLRSRDKPLTMRWFDGFLSRWPELRVIKPRGLEHSRAKAASKETVDQYFKELHSIMLKYDLLDKPHCIFNIDEKGLSQNHVPPHVVAGTDVHPPEVTAGKSSTTTIIGCGSAAGTVIPPYFVFPGARMRNELLTGATPGTDGRMSATGWSNSEIFRQYLSEHFIKYVPGDEQHILLLLDGHKTHISVDLIDWAKNHNIIIFILPAHTSHILQPLDVSCFGPLQKIYNNLCHKQMRENASVVTRYNVCELGCKAYNMALTPHNLQSAFKKTGVFPFNRVAIESSVLAPAEVFKKVCVENDAIERENETENMDVGSVTLQNEMEDSETEANYFSKHEDELMKVKSEGEIVRKVRNCLGKVVSGKAITEEITETNVRNHLSQQSQVSRKNCKTQKSKSGKIHKLGKENCKKVKRVSITSQVAGSSVIDSPVPGPSHIYQSEDTESDEEVSENEKCCVCKKFTPDAIRNSSVLIFTNWGQCDDCGHWVHLRFCTNVTAIRRNSVFKCMHCN